MHYRRIQHLAALSCLLILLSPYSCAAVSLMQRIRESSNLTVFTRLLSDTGLDRQLDSNESCTATLCFVVFAPSDEAFAASADAVASLVDQADDRLRLVNQHIVTGFSVGNGRKALLSSWPDLGSPVGRDVGFGRALILPASSSVLFWQAKESAGKWSYHANNARINVSLSNQEAENGVFHVLDDVALPLGRDLPFQALLSSLDPVVKRMSIGRSLKIFKDWVARDTEYQFLYDALIAGTVFGVRTAFLPTDAAWAALPEEAWQRLNSSADLYRGVLIAHIAPNVSLFTGWLDEPAAAAAASSASPYSAVDFVTGHSEYKSHPARLLQLLAATGRQGQRRGLPTFVSVGGVVAGVGVGGPGAANLAVRDAVVHAVDRVLAYSGFQTLSAAARRLAPGFHELCARFEGCARLMEGGGGGGGGAGDPAAAGCTLFAPADVAGLTSDGAAAQELERILKLHFVPNRLIARFNMTDNLTVSVSNGSNGHIRFRHSSDFNKIWVEGRLQGSGFVRTELLSWDEPAGVNCALHIISSPLGRPVLTLRQLIASQPELSAASAYLNSDNFQPDLGATNRNFTAFVPNNRLMAALEEFLQGVGNSSLMSIDAIRDETFRSLILPGDSIVADDLPSGGPFLYHTASLENNETVSISVSDHQVERILRLFSDTSVIQASVSAGQYQGVNGLLYPVEAMGLKRGSAQMVVGKGSGSMATAGPATVALAVLLSLVATLTTK